MVLLGIVTTVMLLVLLSIKELHVRDDIRAVGTTAIPFPCKHRNEECHTQVRPYHGRDVGKSLHANGLFGTGVDMTMTMTMTMAMAVPMTGEGEVDGMGEKALQEGPLDEQEQEQEQEHQQTDTWAVIVDTSAFWFNYRHAANSLSFYRAVKSLGVPDSRIVLMLASDVSCNSRNVHRGGVYNSKGQDRVELYGENVEVDYRGSEVTVENFLRVMTGRHLPGTPPSKRLDSTRGSNVLVYMTGHGGDGFLKFQDREEIGSPDFADAFSQMWEKRRYRRLMFVADTCQATSLFEPIKLAQSPPNVIGIASSLTGENSYSHHSDPDIGVAVIDRFTHSFLEFFKSKLKSLHDESPGGHHGDNNDNWRHNHKQLGTVEGFIQSFKPEKLHSHIGWATTLNTSLSNVPLSEFFSDAKRINERIKHLSWEEVLAKDR